MATVKLTQTLVTNLVAEDKDFFVFDETLKGFGVKVTPAGRKSFFAQYWIHGKKRRLYIGRFESPWKVAGARRVAEEILAKAALGDDPAQKKREARNDPTLQEFSEIYMNAIESGEILSRSGQHHKGTTRSANASRLKRHIIPLLGRRQLMTLTRQDLIRFQADVARGVTALDERTGVRGRAIVTGGQGTAAKALNLLSAMLSYAVSEGYLASNPALGVKRFASRKLMRTLTAEELASLGDVLANAEQEGVNTYAIAIIRLLILTGARKGEIESLQWSFIDWQRKILALPESKTGAKTIYAGPAAITILEQHRQWKTNSPYVFPALFGDGYFKGVPKIWNALKKQAGLNDVRLHDLRHCFASWAVDHGTPLYTVGKLLGHSQQSTTQRYAHLADNPVRIAADLTSEALAKTLMRKEGVES